MAANPALETVDLALQAAKAYQRPDLAARLQQARRGLIDPTVRVLVVGEFKQGKSQLVNALVNAPVCPVDDDIATAVPTAVRYAETPEVVLVREGGTEDEPPVTLSVPMDQLAEHVSEAGNPGNRERLQYAEVGIPRKLLRQGLVLVDTPGVGGLGSAHGASTMAALPSADAVMLVSDASQSYTEPEFGFPAPGGPALPQCDLRSDQDRLLPRVAKHRRTQPRAPPRRGGRSRADPGVVDAPPARGAHRRP